jgi:hypothetical protein
LFPEVFEHGSLRFCVIGALCEDDASFVVEEWHVIKDFGVETSPQMLFAKTVFVA